jgi:shikimate kinase
MAYTFPFEGMIFLMAPAEPAPPSIDRCVAVIGMNGVGKSHFGRSLAQKLGRTCIDIDREFEKTHGDIHRFIEQHGWEVFRVAEQELVPRWLEPAYVVVLGGGTIESPEVRRWLKERAVVIWIQAGRKHVQRNLRVAKVERPEFKGRDMPAAVKELLRSRTPLYRDAADIALFPHVRYSQQVAMAMVLLRKRRAQ